MLLGLEALHSRGILHGVLKAENVFIDGKGNCKVADISGGMWTRIFGAPEQHQNKKWTFSCDVYSLGIILFELCTNAQNQPIKPYNYAGKDSSYFRIKEYKYGQSGPVF